MTDSSSNEQPSETLIAVQSSPNVAAMQKAIGRLYKVALNAEGAYQALGELGVSNLLPGLDSCNLRRLAVIAQVKKDFGSGVLFWSE